MKTQQKLLLVILLNSALLGIALYYLSNYHSNKIKSLNEMYTNQYGKNVENIIAMKSATLKQVAHDYTYWDDMVRFVHTQNQKWAKENLETMMANFKIDAVWVFDSLKNNFYSIVDTNYSKLSRFAKSNSLFQELNSKKLLITHEYINNLVIELIGATIHPTNDPDRSTPPKGYMVFAKIWDNTFFEHVEQITETNLRFVTDILKAPGCSNNTLIAYTTVKDIENKPLGYLIIEKDDTFFFELEASANKLFGFTILFSLLTLISFAYFSTMWVSKPLRLIEDNLTAPTEKKIKRLGNYSIEFSKISGLIVNFYDNIAELKKATQKAENASKLKTNFLNNMSHEIRTPMNGIMGFSDQILKKDTSEKDKVKYSRYIKQCCHSLLHTVNSVLDISLIETKEQQVNKQNFYINEIIENLKTLFENTAELKPNLKVCFITNDEKTMLFSDKDLITKLMYYLVENAIKFTTVGSIEVGNIIKDDKAIYYVKDTGIGISFDKQKLIFESFRQVDESATRPYGGNGLGLAVCKGIANILHGELWVDSELGKGSTFFFSIKLS